MNISIHIDAESSAAELIALSNFSKELAVGRVAHVASGSVQLTAPADPAELDEPETVVVAGTETPKRRRRTKDELRVDAIVAANAAAAAEQGAIAPGEPGNEQPASTQPAAVTDTGSAGTEPAATTAPATASPSDDGKDYTEAEVQDLAGKVARTVGPEVVKGKIAELGAARIADLTQEQRNALGKFLVSKLP